MWGSIHDWPLKFPGDKRIGPFHERWCQSIISVFEDDRIGSAGGPGKLILYRLVLVLSVVAVVFVVCSP